MTHNALPSEEIQEGNKLIAEFMGGQIREAWRVGDSIHYTWTGEYVKEWRGKMGLPIVKEMKEMHILTDHLFFHSSWNWLMPVVEKINSLQVPEDSRGDVTYVVTIEPGYCVISAGGESIVSEKQAFDSGLPLIEIVYEAVVEFIKWHNEQKVKP